MANNQFVTRDQFEEFLANSEAFEFLQSVPQSQRQPLFDIGKSVCQIARPGGGWRSGFHLGGGWIMTALHVVSKKETLGAEYVSEVSFHFPTKPAIVAASRSCIFSNFRGAVAEDPRKDVVKDLALVYVPEVLEPEYSTITGLVSPFQEPPDVGDRVYLVHFGRIDGVRGDQTPQQFSVNGNVILGQEFNHPSGNRYSTHNTYCRPGSSGAPLLVFRENMKKFLVAGVHFAGFEIDGKSTGYALWFNGENWLQSTVTVASDFAANINPTDDHASNLIPIYERLQKQLEEHNLRAIVNKSRPDLVEGEFEDIIFQTE